MSRLLLLSLLVLAAGASAQPSLSFGGLVAVPRGEFDAALGSPGGGFSMTALYAIPGTPLAIGGEGALTIYGYERREVPLSLTIPDVRVGVSTSNNLAHLLAVVRLQVPSGGVRPYAEGVAGLTYLFTETTVGDDYYYDEYGEPFSSVTYDDVALAAGGGAGVLVTLHRGLSDEGRPFSVALDASVRYLAGGEATYLARGDIARYRNGTIRLDPRRSRTDLLTPRLGVSFTF